MDQKRFLLFIVLSMSILIGWNLFIARRQAKPRPVAQNQAVREGDGQGVQGGEAEAKKGPGPELADADRPDGKADRSEPENPEAKAPPEDKPIAEATEAGAANQAEEPPAAVPAFPEKKVELGAIDPATGYRQLVTITSHGAAIEKIELSDPHYRALQKGHPPLTVVGDKEIVPRTFEVAIAQLPDAAFDKRDWELKEVGPEQAPYSMARFQLTVEGIQLEKKYELKAAGPQNENEAAAYELAVELTVRNTGKGARTVNYVLQGPTGVPLENIENTQKFRDVVVGFETKPHVVDSQLMTAKAIADKKIEEWKQAIKYIGVDCQFFAALVCPDEDQLKFPYIKSAKQQLVGPNLAEKSEISVELTSVDLALEPGQDVTHAYHLFAGPKRDDVLPEGASKVLDFGMFHLISRPMVALLKTFYKLFGNWGIAIICLTIVVRGALFPLSIKQARGAAKMQQIQPEIQAIKEKYGNDKEKLARAQMELFRKHNYNPAAGCLPIFLQLPIFMGLYQALNHAVDLRLAGFLWVDNLAAPDALFRLPFPIPLLGWQDFNLLPLITTGLFLVQQKMFMPPAANEEQALQQKMMNIMTVVMGALFYRVPAGLCVYFIASSLWGLGERKLLPKLKPAAATEPPPPPSRQDRRKGPGPDDEGDNGGGGGFWGMLLKAAEKETSARRPTHDRRK